MEENEEKSSLDQHVAVDKYIFEQALPEAGYWFSWTGKIASSTSVVST